MSRRRVNEDASSLDMLLDTMCNTFGGIVFIALLLSIISGAVTKQQSENEAATRTISRIDTEQIEAALQEQVRHYENAIAMATASRDGEMREDYSRASVSSEATLAAETNVLAKIRVQEREVRKLDREIEDSVGHIDDARYAIRDLRQRINAARQASTRTLRMPKVHMAHGMRNVFVAVADGKFYAVNLIPDARHEYDGDKYDKVDVDVESGREKDVVELRPHAGQAVSPQSLRTGKISMALNNYNPQKHLICFLVWQNSFGEFNLLKRAFIERGFSYNWHIHSGPIEIVVSSDTPSAQ